MLGEEISSLKTMKMFVEFLGKPADIPKGSLLSSKAIISIVYNPDGSFKKFKARLVARGDILKNIYDPDTFAGTVRADTLRLILSLAAEHALDFVSHDIKTAFLYSDLKPEENIYIRRPAGVSDDIMPYNVQLKKCLYGLPQASKYFDEHLSSRLLAMDFVQCVSGAEVLLLSRGGEQAILSKHVGDCLLAAIKGSDLLSFVNSEFGNSYTLTTNIEPTNFVGMAITRDRPNKSLTLIQPHFVGTIWLFIRFLLRLQNIQCPKTF